MSEKNELNYNRTGYIRQSGDSTWFGEVSVGGGTVCYDITGCPKAGYRGEINIYWTQAQGDRSAYRFDPTGITSGTGVQQIEAKDQWILDDLIKLDGQNDSDRGYALFCELSCYLPPPI